MAQPLYFLRNARREQITIGGNLNHQVLADFGLDETFRDVEGVEKDCSIANVIGMGPEDNSGCVLCYKTAEGRFPDTIVYDDALDWVKVSDDVWMGLDPNSPPLESELRRRRQIGGTRLELRGQLWFIPMVRSKDGFTKLPCEIVFGNTDRLHLPIKPEFVKWWETTEKAIQWFWDPDYQSTATDLELAELAVFNFGLNYRYGKLEQNALRLIDSENMITVLAWNVALFDSIDSIEHIQKG